MEQSNKSYRFWVGMGGILLIAVAGFFQNTLLSEKNVLYSVASTICSGFGGFLLSMTFTSDKFFLKKISPRIESITRQTALIASQISNIVNSSEKEDNTITSQLEQILPHIYAVTTDLEALAEKNFDPQVLKNTKTSIGCLITMLKEYDMTSDNSSTISQIMQRLKEIYSNIPVEPLTETVYCPYCDAPNEVKIGPNPPSSAMPICCKCGERFHANRQKNGEILTRRKGAYSEKKKDPDNFSK